MFEKNELWKIRVDIGMSSNHLNRHVMMCERKCHVDVVSLEEMTRRELRLNFVKFEKLTRISYAA